MSCTLIAPSFISQGCMATHRAVIQQELCLHVDTAGAMGFYRDSLYSEPQCLSPAPQQLAHDTARYHQGTKE